ncbi:hypothetical protein [Enterocloster bolteae]|nr:hypothetical protein [Enterocloster bolteae]MCQ5144336.1 hypothetical protein [Enterocloster bolteae]
MMLKDIRLDLSNVVANPSKSTVQVVGARPETDKESVITGYRLEIATRKCSKNPVKLPNKPEVQQNIENLQKLLKKQDFVEVKLMNHTVMAYALISSGNLISGVSIKADSFTIVEPEVEEDLLK